MKTITFHERNILMQLTSRQKEIIQMLKQQSPMTGEEIANKLNLGVPTIRTDLRILSALELLTSRPKVGYSYQIPPTVAINAQKYDQPISEILLPSTEIHQDATLEEAVTTMFLADVGSLYVIDAEGTLVGLISRKDLLRASFTNKDAPDLVASIVMTRMPNIVTVNAKTSIRDAGKLLIKHNVDSLPVITDDDTAHPIGKITKNRIFKYFMDQI